MIQHDWLLAKRIAAHFFGNAAQTLIPIVGKGSVNHIFLAARDEVEIIIRLSDIGDQARALQFYEKERWCIAQATALHIPSPTVLAVDVLEGRPYMLQTRVPGVNGADAKFSAEAICFTLGQYARRIHSIALSGFGEDLADFYVSDGAARWQHWLSYNLDSLTNDDPLLALGVYERKQSEAIRHQFALLKSQHITLALNHGDLSPRNTVVDETGRIALLDWGCAEAHMVPHYELLCLMQQDNFQESHMQAFVNGYGISADEFARVLVELNSLRLLKAFDLVRWAIDRNPTRISEKVSDAQRVVQSLAL